MTKETETIHICDGIATFDFSLKWWQIFRRWWQFKRRYRQWKSKRWNEKHPIFAQMMQDEITKMAHDVDTFLAYGEKR